MFYFEGVDSSFNICFILFFIKIDSNDNGILIEEDGMYGIDNVFF